MNSLPLGQWLAEDFLGRLTFALMLSFAVVTTFVGVVSLAMGSLLPIDEPNIMWARRMWMADFVILLAYLTSGRKFIVVGSVATIGMILAAVVWLLLWRTQGFGEPDVWSAFEAFMPGCAAAGLVFLCIGFFITPRSMRSQPK